jgi:hypothetical protein
MTDVNTLLARLEALRASYHAGVTEVSYDGKTSKFRSLDEMRTLIASLEQELGVSRPSSVVVRGVKGW